MESDGRTGHGRGGGDGDGGGVVTEGYRLLWLYPALLTCVG